MLNLWSGYRQLLCANGPPFAIAIGEDICEQNLALAVVSRFDHGAIHNSCFTINPYMQIFETLALDVSHPQDARVETGGVGSS